jgi:hypothetical protein
MAIKKISRSSKTGKFVTDKYAAKHKATTETETVKSKKSVIRFLVIGDPGRGQIDLVLMFWNNNERALYKSADTGRINNELPTVFDSRQQANKAVRATRRYIRKYKLDWKGNYIVVPIKVNL